MSDAVAPLAGRGPDPLRLLTLNLQHGTPARGTAREDRATEGGALFAAAHEIAATGADVVLLQEVDRGQRRSGRVDQAALLADELGMRWRFAPSLAGSATGLRLPAVRATAPRLPGYGVALLTRLPVRSWHVRRLRGGGPRVLRGGSPWWAARAWSPRLDPARVCLAAVLETPGGPLSVAVTHLSVDPPTARRQLADAVAVLGALPGPRVLGGDLNLRPAEVAGVVADGGLTPLASAPTFTNARPRIQLDHLLGDGAVTAVSAARTHHLAISDHAGLSVDVVLEH
ncbi:endonuclease/exonuclease/phosphatase family protein [Georgenia sp. SYP-B2076]|uniref:endonuclease/exonuclease/phosphatase family protein n=1 Tax=Georgenia sp. SYP-B2076 TaxID=2495881 RepID=UPI000F8F2E80|nr:endonuclease/exonuclease/phosphatase family protein [Georgenia sp. SYP-B2076]